MEKVDVLGVKIDKVTTELALNKIKEFLISQNKKYIATVNPEFVMAAQKDAKFKEIINNANLAIADGIGLAWAAKYLSLRSKIQNRFFLRLIEICKIVVSGSSLVFYPKYCRTILPERISGVDLMWSIGKIAEQNNCSIFFLGGFDNVGKVTAKKFKEVYSNLKIAGIYEGSHEEKDDYVISELINKSQADIIFVAYGQVKQEKWIWRNINNLTSVKLAMGVGGSFDFISGKVHRAPRFFQKIGLEWLWRFFSEPWRLGRIITATFRFINSVYKYKIKSYDSQN